MIPRAPSVHHLILAVIAMLVSACGTPALLHEQSRPDIRKKWKELHLDSPYHVGLSIYDATASKTLFCHHIAVIHK